MGQVTASALLQFLANVLYVVVFLVTAVRAARQRVRTDVDVSLFFGATAIAVGLSWISEALGVREGPVLSALGGALIMTLPYCLLRLVDDFSVVPSIVKRLAEAGLLASVVLVFVVPQPYPLAMVGALVIYFVVLGIYDVVAVQHTAKYSRGVARRRMQAVALGSIFLVLDVVAYGLAAALPGLAPVWIVAAQFFGLASGLAYVAGFAPPGVFRRAWQAPELRRGLRQTAELIRRPDEIALIEDLERVCAETVGAQQAAIGLWNSADNTFLFHHKGQSYTYPADTLVAGRVLASQRARFTANLTVENPALSERHTSFQARAALIAPISVGKRRFGVVVATAPRAPLFAEDDLDLLQLLADQVGVILENRALVDEMSRERARSEALAAAEEERRQANAQLEIRVAERTAELQQAIQELESFSYSVSHDLRAPLRTIDGFVQAFIEDYGDQLDAIGKNYLERTRTASQSMGQRIDGLLRLSRVSRGEMVHETVDLSELVRSVVSDLERTEPERAVTIDVAEGMVVDGDPQLLRVALENLLGNAWKFTSNKTRPRISFDAVQSDGDLVFRVRDNGAGFDMAYADKLFQPFQRLHGRNEFPGTGIGLATVERIIRRHGGRIWGEGAIDGGAVFSFTLAPRIIVGHANVSGRGETEDVSSERSTGQSSDLVGGR